MNRGQSRVKPCLYSEDPLRNRHDVVKFHFDLEFLDEPLHKLVIGYVWHIFALVSVQLEDGVHVVHAQVIVGYLCF